MNDVSRHISALSAFDDGGDDDQFSALQSKIAGKLVEQRSKAKDADKERAIVQEKHRKENAEIAVTNQIVNACGNALKIAPNEDVATLQRVIDRLRDPTVNVADPTENLDGEIASLSRKVESLMKKFKGLSDEREGYTELPTKVAQAITSLRCLLGDNRCASLSEKDIDSLEEELTAKLTDGHDVEKIGMKRIALLRNRLSKEMDSADAKKRLLVKSKELELQLRMKQSELTSVSKSANKENEGRDIEKRELEKAKRRYESSKAVLNREGGQPEGVIEKDVILNMEKFKEQNVRKSRSSFRQHERERKTTLQRERAEEAAREEEARLFRLQALASSCPYTKNIEQLSADIHKTTESRKQDVFSGRSDLLDCQANRQTNFGTERLFSDSKFRLSK